MKKIAFFAYGMVSYGLFFVSFLYMIAFVGNFEVAGFVPKTIDSGATGSLSTAIMVNIGIIILFGLQHTIMARPGFKAAWTKIIPKPIERSTYVNFTTAILVLLFSQWRPMTDIIWQVDGSLGKNVLLGIYFGGYLLVLYASFLINHFDLFGLRQVFLFLFAKKYTHPPLASPTVYRIIRHPILLGWTIAFWATPTMTVGHLLFAMTMTAYILIAIPFEERDLESALGEEYRLYKSRTPMLLPLPRKAGLPICEKVFS
jgi:protein-S-isoprenylcysteine O-methyltransferase Ste14